MPINLQPTLENERVVVRPLLIDDFEAIYQVASDPKIWEQHPNKSRYQREVFKNFFDGAIQSGGAFCVIDKSTGDLIGSTRFYDFDEEAKSILIGYTFYSTNCWGKGFNHEVKSMMMNYIFQFADEVIYHIGADNIRSLISIERLGTTKIGEQEVTYFGESPKMNCVYKITKAEWEDFKRK